MGRKRQGDSLEQRARKWKANSKNLGKKIEKNLVRARQAFGWTLPQIARKCTLLVYTVPKAKQTDIVCMVSLASSISGHMAKPRCTRVQLPKGLSRVSGAENMQRYVGEMC